MENNFRDIQYIDKHLLYMYKYNVKGKGTKHCFIITYRLDIYHKYV